MKRLTLAILAVVAIGAWSKLPSAHAQRDATGTRLQIQQLEQEVFGRRILEDDLLAQLETLATRKSVRRRKPIADELIKNGQGWQAEIASFADRSRDIELRELCAEIVEQLDSNWRDTESGKQWLGLVKEDSRRLFADAWKRLGEEPTDLAAAAIVLSAEPEDGWKCVEQYIKANQNGSGVPVLVKEAQSKYLLLRIRELSPDPFAAARIKDGLTLWKNSAAAIYPATSVQGPAWRTVGHVILKRFETATPSLGVANNNDRMFFRLHPKQFQIFAIGRSNAAGKFKLPGVQLLGFKSFDYGPYSHVPAFTRPGAKRKKVKLTPTATLKNKVESQVAQLGSRIPYVPIVDVSNQADPVKYMSQTRQQWVKLPWWWERYISAEVADGLTFASRRREDADAPELSDGTPAGIAPTGQPSEARPADLDSASFVILEPHVIRKSKSDLIKAEVACDRIREELQNQSVQIVDRKMLQKLFEERERNKTTAPLTSFDTMVRLAVHNDRRDVFAVLSMVDLSTGSVIGRERLVWPIPEKNIPRIQGMIKKCITKVKKNDKSKVRIRLLAGQSPKNRQLRFLADSAVESMAHQLRENRAVELVDHFESESAAEESFLLMAGLSQMASSRNFQPLADSTVRVTLEESEEFGKSLSATAIALKLEAIDGADKSARFSGVAGELESKLLPDACRWLAQNASSFKKTPSDNDDATAMLEAQAKSELDSIRSINPSKSVVDQAIERQQKALAALKLEPNSVDAAYELVFAYGLFLRKCRRDDSRHGGVYVDAMRRIISLHRKIKTDSSRIVPFRDTVFSVAKVRRRTDLSRQENQDFQLAVLDLIESGLAGSIDSVSTLTPRILKYAVDDLRSFPYSNDELKVRLAKIVDDVHRLEKDRQRWNRKQADPTSYATKRGRQRFEGLMKDLRRETIECCADLRMTEEFDELLEIVVDDLGPADDVAFRILKSDLYAIGDKSRKEKIVRLIDVAMKKRDELKSVARAKRIRKRKPKSTTLFTQWTWPKIDIYRNKAATVDSTELKISLPEHLPQQTICCPLARNRSGLFVLASDAIKAGFGTLDSHYYDGESASQNKAIGFLPLDREHAVKGAVQWFQLPDEMLPAKIQGAVATKTHLLIGTNGHYRMGDCGLYLLDLKTKRWKYFGLDSGLPVQWVTGMHRLSGNRVLCTGNVREAGPRHVDTWFVFDMNSLEPLDYTAATNALSLQGKKLGRKLLCVWEVNGSVGGLNEWNIWQGLLSRSPTATLPTGPRDADAEIRFYQNAYSACVQSDSLFYLNSKGLHRVDNGVDVARSWTLARRLSSVLPDRGAPAKDSTFGTSPLNHRHYAPYLSSSSDMPMSGRCYLATCGKLLLLIEDRGTKILGYDPSSDTWYGPVRTQRNHYAMAEGNKVWLGGPKLRVLSEKDLIRAATDCDRVMTGDELKQKQRDVVAEMSLLNQAKFAFTNEDFPKTTSLLNQVTTDNPEDSEAWMLRGFLYDTFALNRPTESGKAYRMAEKLESSQSGKFTAAWLRIRMLQRSRKLNEVADAAKETLESYPGISSLRQQELRSLANQVSD